MISGGEREGVYQFVLELEQYAAENGSKRRVLDTISDIKQELQNGQSEESFQKSCSEIDELMAYMAKQKTGRRKGQEAAENDISKDEIRKRIEDSFQKCRNTNALLEGNSRADCQFCIQEAGRKMQDYANVEANYEQVVNESRFCGAFEQIGQTYAQQVNGRMARYVDEVDENYNNAVNGVRKMFSALPPEFSMISQKDFFLKWDKNQNMVKEGCRNAINRTSCGEEEISGFAQKHIGPISKLIRKQNRKKRNVKLFPLYVILIALLVFEGGKILQEKLLPEQQSAESGTTSEDQDFLQKVWGSVRDGAARSAGSAIGGEVVSAAVPAMVILLIVWYLFMRRADKQCRGWINNAIGTYLSEELSAARPESVLQEKLDAKYQELGRYMSGQYERIIADILGETFVKEELAADRLEEMSARWNQIKKG